MIKRNKNASYVLKLETASPFETSASYINLQGIIRPNTCNFSGDDICTHIILTGNYEEV